MYASTERMRGLTYAAAAACDAAADEDPIVELAKALCDEAYRSVTHEAIQVHGGIGFTWEHDVQLFYKRALRYSASLGTSRSLLYATGRRLARLEAAWDEYTCPVDTPLQEDRATHG